MNLNSQLVGTCILCIFLSLLFYLFRKQIAKFTYEFQIGLFCKYILPKEMERRFIIIAVINIVVFGAVLIWHIVSNITSGRAQF